jgi:hypothetical protein
MLLAACGKSAQEPDCGTGFLDALFSPWYPGMIQEPVDTTGYTQEEQALVESALARAAEFSPLVPSIDERDEMAYVMMERQGLERTAVMLSGPGVQQEAADYLADAVVYYEWEGFAEGPLAEAACAEEYLAAHPDTGLESFLTAFLLHRYRAAWECGKAMGDSGTTTEALSSYIRWHEAAMELRDPLLTLVTDEIDRAAHVYMIQDFPEWCGGD